MIELIFFFRVQGPLGPWFHEGIAHNVDQLSGPHTVQEIRQAVPSTSRPEILFGIMCLRFSLTQNAMAAVLELLKLRLDFTKIKSIDEVLESLDVASMKAYKFCANCGTDLETGECPPTW